MRQSLAPLLIALGTLGMAPARSGAPPAVPARPITEEDLYAFRWVADPRISPDGSRVAFVLVSASRDRKGYDSGLYLVSAEGGEPRRLTAGPRDVAPRWSPDGRFIAFLRTADDTPQIYLLPLEGGEARALTSLKKGAGQPAWSPDGRSVVFTSTTAVDLKDDDAPGAGTDVRIVTRPVYRSDGEGFLDPREVSHVFILGVDGGAPKALTSDPFGDQDPFLSRDGTRVFFTSDRRPQPWHEPLDDDLFSVRTDGGDARKEADIDGPIRNASLSPDSRAIAFAGWFNPSDTDKVPSYAKTELILWRQGEVRALTAGDDDEIGSAIIADQFAPRGQAPIPILWGPDGRSLLTVTSLHGRSGLTRYDIPSGSRTSIAWGERTVTALSATPDGRRAVLLAGSAVEIGDLYLFEPGKKDLRRLTDVNRDLLRGLTLSQPEPIRFRSFDGEGIEGWVMRPIGFAPGIAYPLIVEIHGGPHIAYGAAFFHEFQWLAAQGYGVLFVNPRGSATYGRRFGNAIQYRYPGDDFKDIMAGLDTALKQGWADPARLGVTGGSGGGLLTNWAIGHTDRFAAAVTDRCVSEWISFYYSADFTLFIPTWFRNPPFLDPQDYIDRSPVTYAASIRTPLMILHAEEDWRTPIGQGEAMFRALLAQKKRTVMIRFPGEGHELSRSGQPRHRVERLQHLRNWFDIYLKGKRITLYDDPVIDAAPSP